MLQNNRKLHLVSSRWISYFFVLALVTLTVFGCSDNDTVSTLPDQKSEVPESFTFFGLGANTRLTKTIRQDLIDHLGSEAVEKRGTVDLTVRPAGLLETHFNRLHTLNRGLNSNLGARVEHDITRLSYRYPQQKDTPFKFVQLVFSNETAKPLYFDIVLKKEGSATVDTLEEKYGPPETIGGDAETLSVLFWEKDNDTLIVSEIQDRFGEPEYHLMFYFVNNLNQLLETEQKAVERREKELKKAGKSAF